MIDAISTSAKLSGDDKSLLFDQQSHLTHKTVLGRRGLERLDLLLLVVESLDLNAGQAMLWTSDQLGFQSRFPNRVELWKRRCHNPLRRSTRRGTIKASDSEALILLVCSMAYRLYPLLRQLLSSKEPNGINQERWNLFSERFSELLEERMNTRRGAVQRLLLKEFSPPLYRQLVLTLALCVGRGGVDRLRATLFDPKP